MDLNQFLHWFTQHENLSMIIQWLIAIIALLSLALMVFWLKGKRFQEEGVVPPDMEGTLRRILEGLQGGATAPGRVTADVSASDISTAPSGNDGESFSDEAKAEVESAAEESSEVHDSVTPCSKAAKAGPEIGNANSEDLKALQGLLEDSQSRVTDLEAKLKAIESQALKGDDSELKSKIADLEGKLAEYEIIEDDIADLSRFKEENETLKAELALLKEQGGTSSTSTAAATPQPEPGAEVVQESVDTPSADKEAQAAGTEAAESDDPLESIEAAFAGDDLVQEFDAALSEESGPEEPEAEEALLDKAVGDALGESQPEVIPEPAVMADPEPKPVEAPIGSVIEDIEERAEEAPASTESVSTEPQEKVDSTTGTSAPNPTEDLLAEFSVEAAATATGLVEESPAGAPESKPTSAEGSEEPALGSVDTDKMLEEMGALAKLKTDSSESVLEEEMDVDKMAAEALSLGSEDR